ncbi:tight adherence protein C [Microbacterium resistens]|uniref:Tight adherence protein C n=1 Tax=Microbacterium resistens TaxID=156977 RepID=A0ABU1S765_9MICO|nr:type II secretion system F family protein [Microbacterium resistens]MDR6865459.1 tight adherence protein C [Microbacterium resistens]
MSPISALAVSVLLGGALAAGVLMAFSSFPRWRSSSLIVRIAPHLRDVVDLPEARSGHRPVGGGLMAGIAARLPRALGGGDAAIAVRLAQAGVRSVPASFRIRQLGWALGGLGAGAVITIVLALAGRMSLPAVLLPVLCACGAGLACDALLKMRARSRVARLGEEMPTVLEFLALSLSAGEGLPDALRRVASVGSGELSGELRDVLLAVGTGSGLADALGECARRLQIPALSRAVDQIVAALERGAPLASVLQAQASDAREETKRGLIERAGRKEIYMLVPLVFLILPLSVIFAVFPGVFVLRLGIG